MPDDPLISRADCIAMLKGIRNALLVCVPAWLLFLYWWFR